MLEMTLADAAGLKLHEIAEIFPMMNESNLAALARDIKAHGQLETLTLCNGKILDGRNRNALMPHAS